MTGSAYTRALADPAARAHLARLRAEALCQPCPYCHQPAGQPCLNIHTGQPLHHQPAHTARLQETAR